MTQMLNIDKCVEMMKKQIRAEFFFGDKCQYRRSEQKNAN